MANTDAARQQTANDYQEIDLLELARVIWGKIWFVILGFVVGAALAFGISKFMITPIYQAESTIYILSKSTSITSLADLQLGSQLAEDYKIIATSRDVVEGVIDGLGLDTTYESLVKSITVTNPSNSHMLKVSVKDADPVAASNICNKLVEQLRYQISEKMSTDLPSVIQRAVVPKHKSSPSNSKNTAIGALIGTVLVAGYIIIRYLMDDTIKTEDDVKKYLELDTLAQFPYIKGWEDSSKKSSKKKAKASKSGSAKK